MEIRRSKQIEKWMIRFVVIQLIALVFAQFIIRHEAISPYLNKAIRSEGVFGQKSSKTDETIQQSPYMWYDESKKSTK